MPTTKPRMQLSLPPDDFKFFTEFAALQGMPASTMITHYLHEAIPSFRQLATVMQELKRTDFSVMTDSQRAALAAALDAGSTATEDSLVMIGNAVREVDAALPRDPQKRSKKPVNSLIHRHKPSNPLPTRVSAGTKSKKKGAGNAST